MAFENLADLMRLLSPSSDIGSSRFMLLIGVIFLLFIGLERIFAIWLISILKKKYPKTHKRVVWFSTLPNLVQWFKFIWIEKTREKDIIFLINFIRILQIIIVIVTLSFFVVGFASST